MSLSPTGGAARRYPPLKTATLVALLGPAIGGLVMIAVAAGMEAYGYFTDGIQPLRSAEDVLAFASFAALVELYSYFFGALPALVAAVLFGLYLRKSGAHPHLAGMAIGTATIVCSFAVVLLDTYDGHRHEAAWGGLGLAALFGLIVSFATGVVIDTIFRIVEKRKNANKNA